MTSRLSVAEALTRPSFGVELFGYTDARTLVAEARVAESLGFSSIWVGDSQRIWRDPYALLGALADSTDCVLGIGVTNPVTRHTMVTAAAAMTLQELTEGRFVLGVGSGFSSVGAVGLARAGLDGVRAFVTDLRHGFAGYTVGSSEDPRGLAFADADPTLHPPPVLLAGTGPRMLRLAGEAADGAILGAAPLDEVGSMVGHVVEGSAGRPEGRGPIVLAPPCAVSDHEDRAVDAVRPHVARSVMRHAPKDSPVASSYALAEHLAPGATHAALVDDAQVRRFAIVGPAEQCRSRIADLFDAGVDHIVVRPYGVGSESRLDAMEQFRRAVEPLWG